MCCLASPHLHADTDDYTLARTTVQFEPEQNRSCVTLQAVDDVITEGTETFDLCLEGLSVSTKVDIQDSDGTAIYTHVHIHFQCCTYVYIQWSLASL